MSTLRLTIPASRARIRLVAQDLPEGSARHDDDPQGPSQCRSVGVSSRLTLRHQIPGNDLLHTPNLSATRNGGGTLRYVA
jgi:hypothetical protein